MGTSVLIETHGCKLNTADSQKLAQEFLGAGYLLASEGQTPDVCVLNSCTVTHVADRKARHAASAMRRRYPRALIVATGCYVERAKGAVEALSYVDMALSNRDKARAVQEITARLGQSFEPQLFPLSPGRALLPGRTRAAVKIQEGCDQVCAYCIVPKVRGRERSIASQEIVDQVRGFAEAGVQEVVLTGTQLGSYGTDSGEGGLRDLISRVLGETDMPRLRVSSLQPLEVTDGLLDLWSGQGRGRLCPHFHLPLQSGSSGVLKRMRRRYSSSEFLRTVERVKEAVPGCSVTTDIITGFPGETDDDHQATLSVMDVSGFAAVHVFPYSARSGTSSAHFNESVPDEVKAVRAAELRRVAGGHSERHRMHFVGSVRPVLWEVWRKGFGLTDNYLKVKWQSSGAQANPVPARGLIEDVRLTGVVGDVLTGVSTG